MCLGYKGFVEMCDFVGKYIFVVLIILEVS